MSPKRAAALRTLGEAHVNLREHLVAMTGRLLEDVPLAALTTRQIARHAGVSDGVLYNHFADKRALVIASLLDRYERLVERFEAQAPVVGEGTVESNLRTFARALSALEADALVLGGGLLSDPELLQRFWTEIHRSPLGPARLMRPLQTYLEGERTAGRLSASLDVQATVTLVSGACAMIAFTRRLNPGVDGTRLDAHLDAAIGTLIRGLGPAEAPGSEVQTGS
jgi:AcrR family transcriptional regulator